MSSTDGLISWGVLGTGAIAHKFARALTGCTTGRLVGVGSRTMESAARFADEFGAPHRYNSYDALLAAP